MFTNSKTRPEEGINPVFVRLSVCGARPVFPRLNRSESTESGLPQSTCLDAHHANRKTWEAGSLCSGQLPNVSQGGTSDGQIRGNQ